MIEFCVVLYILNIVAMSTLMCSTIAWRKYSALEQYTEKLPMTTPWKSVLVILLSTLMLLKVFPMGTVADALTAGITFGIAASDIMRRADFLLFLGQRLLGINEVTANVRLARRRIKQIIRRMDPGHNEARPLLLQMRERFPMYAKRYAQLQEVAVALASAMRRFKSAKAEGQVARTKADLRNVIDLMKRTMEGVRASLGVVSEIDAAFKQSLIKHRIGEYPDELRDFFMNAPDRIKDEIAVMDAIEEQLERELKQGNVVRLRSVG